MHYVKCFTHDFKKSILEYLNSQKVAKIVQRGLYTLPPHFSYNNILNT